MKSLIFLHLRIFKHLFLRSIKLISFEKKNFYFYIASGLLHTIGNVLLLQTAFTNVPQIEGWNVYNVMSLYATYRLTSAIYGFFIGSNLIVFYDTIRKGNLDLFLIKPASSWFLLSFQKVDFSRIADLISGIGILIYTFSHLNWSYLTLFLFLYLLHIALVIISCSYTLISLTAFMNIRETILNFFEKLMSTTTRFPLRFAGDTIQFVFTWLLPFMFLATIPIEVLENRINIPLAFISASTLAIIYILLARFLWQKCLQRYSSASS